MSLSPHCFHLGVKNHGMVCHGHKISYCTAHRLYRVCRGTDTSRRRENTLFLRSCPAGVQGGCVTMADHVAWGLLLSSLAGGSTTIGGAIGVGCHVLRTVV